VFPEFFLLDMIPNRALDPQFAFSEWNNSEALFVHHLATSWGVT
jgi:hypothetical protein